MTGDTETCLAEQRFPLVRFGWQGIEVSVPSPWELNAHQGDWRAGFASLDDGIATRLRIRWETEGRRQASVDVALDVYFRSLRKRVGRKIEVDVIGPEFLPKRFRDDHAVAIFRWDAQQAALGMVWRCGRQRRVGLVEILFPDGMGIQAAAQCGGNDSRPAVGQDDRVARLFQRRSPVAVRELATLETSHYRTLARRILGSVDDHRADSKTLWAVYGFAFEISDRYRLQRADLVPGRLRFLFQDGRRAWLRVERWAAASQWMKGTPLDRMPGEWLKASRFAPRDVIRQEAFAHRGHDAVRFECSVRGTMLREVRLAGIVWLCRPEDRMYAVAAVDAPDGELDAVAEATRCT